MPISMDERARYGGGGMWNRAFDAGPLTDRKLAKYEKMGFYNPEAIKARSELRAKRAAQRRHGDNFYKGEDGRLIYSPR